MGLIMFELSIVLMIFACGIMFYRNTLIYKIRTKELFIAKRKGDELIDQDKNWKIAYAKYDSMSYNRMMFMLHKWTHKQFYND